MGAQSVRAMVWARRGMPDRRSLSAGAVLVLSLCLSVHCATQCLAAGGTQGGAISDNALIPVRKSEPAVLKKSPWLKQDRELWAPEIFFDDPRVVELCFAIEQKRLDRVEYLVKYEQVDINARGFRNVTPLLWAFPLGLRDFLEYCSERNSEGAARLSTEEFNATLDRVCTQHCRLLKRLMELGADPNIQVSAEEPGSGKRYGPPANLFGGDYRGLSVTHLSAVVYGPSDFTFLPTVMAHGGSTDLVFDARGVTPIFFACAGSLYFPDQEGIRRRPSPENLALLIEKGANLEFRAPEGFTPILAAARSSDFMAVLMLIHAGADFKLRNQNGQDVAYYALEYQTQLKRPARRRREGGEVARVIDPYFLPTVEYLEQHGALRPGKHAAWKREIDELVKSSPSLTIGPLNPFADQWLDSHRPSDVPASPPAAEQ